MAWQTPPTFTDTDVLSAAQLNIIRDDLQYLRGLSSTVNIPFPAVGLDVRLLHPAYWQIRHRAKFLNLYISWFVDPGLVDHLSVSIKINGTELVTGGAGPDPWVPGVTSSAYFSYDVSSLTAGTWYQIEINVDAHDVAHAPQPYWGDTGFNIVRMFESDTSFA